MRKYVKFHHVRFWGSSRVQKLDSDHKLFYLYLITHPNRGTSGLLEINEVDYKKALNGVESTPRQGVGEGLKELEDRGLIVTNKGDMGITYGVFVFRTAGFEVSGVNSVHNVLNDAISRAEKDVILPLIPYFLDEYKDIFADYDDEKVLEKIKKLEGVTSKNPTPRQGVGEGSERGQSSSDILEDRKIRKVEQGKKGKKEDSNNIRSDSKKSEPPSGKNGGEIKFNEGDVQIRAAKKLREYVLGVNEKAPVPDPTLEDLESWAVSLDRLHRLGPPGGDDGYTWEEIRDIMDWAFQDDFWRGNVMSAGKLREQVVKLENQMKRDQKPDSPDNAHINEDESVEDVADKYFENT